MKNVKFRGKKEEYRGKKFRGSNTAGNKTPNSAGFRGQRETVGPSYNGSIAHFLSVVHISLQRSQSQIREQIKINNLINEERARSV